MPFSASLIVPNYLERVFKIFEDITLSINHLFIMKFATAKEHRNFFQNHGWIEFEELISNDQLTLANQAIDQVLAERLNASPERLRLLPSEQLYLQGHDLWRSNSILRKLVTQTRFAEIASELIEKKPLRLGCDQLFPARHQQTQLSATAPQVYTHFLEQTTTLEAVSCLQGVTCGLMLSLGGKETVPFEKIPSEGADIFPSQPGHVIFFRPNIPIKWDSLYLHEGQRFYLIVYTQMSAHYQLQPQDPHTHALKRLGYVFNDKLNDRLHPIIYR